ncbi:MAG: hypothetical protein ABC537_00805 [Candidatus Methanosuratincola sp.]
MAIPSPREVYEIMKSVPEGRVTTVNGIRSALARRHGATICCPSPRASSHGSPPMHPRKRG